MMVVVVVVGGWMVGHRDDVDGNKMMIMMTINMMIMIQLDSIHFICTVDKNITVTNIHNTNSIPPNNTTEQSLKMWVEKQRPIKGLSLNYMSY